MTVMKKRSSPSRASAPRALLSSSLLALAMVLVAPAGADEWVALEEGGFDDTENIAVLSLGAFDDSLYAGTQVRRNSTETADIWKTPRGRTAWRNVTPRWARDAQRVGSMAVFGDHLYVGAGSSMGAEVWRTRGEIVIRFRPQAPPPLPPGIGQLPRPPIVARIEGWENVTPSSGSWAPFTEGRVSSMAVFGGHLYVSKGVPLEIWRTGDGTSWEPVVSDAFGDPTTNNTGKLIVFRDHIYVATSVATVGGGGGCEIWRSSDGERWSALVATGEPSAIRDDGFGDDGVGGCISSSVFEDRLYVGTVNHFESGPQIWRFDGGDWQDVTPPLFFGGTMGVQTLGVYGGKLYGGDRLVRPFLTARIYATSTGEPGPDDWTIVNDGTEMGLGIEAMLAAYGAFYVGTTGLTTDSSDPTAGGRVFRKVPYLIEWLRFFESEAATRARIPLRPLRGLPRR